MTTSWFTAILNFLEKFFGLNKSKTYTATPVLESLQGAVARANSYDVRSVPDPSPGVHVLASWALVAAIANTRVQITVLGGPGLYRLGRQFSTDANSVEYLIVFRRYDYGHHTGVMRHVGTCVCGWKVANSYSVSSKRYALTDVRIIVKHLISTGILHDNFCLSALRYMRFGQMVEIPEQHLELLTL